MAKKNAGKQNGESVAGYFRTLHKESPDLFKERKNDKLLARWLQDHPGVKEVPKNVKTSLANIKSVLRSKKRKRVAQQVQDMQPAGRPVIATRPTGTSKLEGLEHQIDECLISAKNMDREELEDVIGLLRKAHG